MAIDVSAFQLSRLLPGQGLYCLNQENHHPIALFFSDRKPVFFDPLLKVRFENDAHQKIYAPPYMHMAPASVNEPDRFFSIFKLAYHHFVTDRQYLWSILESETAD